MAIILRLDIGTNSIGWAVVDTANNSIVDMGARVFPGNASVSLNELRRASHSKRKQTPRMVQPTTTARNRISIKSTVVYIPLFLSLTAGSLAFFMDWQYWLNISVACLIAFLSLLKK